MSRILIDLAIALYPAEFRHRFGSAMRQAFVERVRARRQTSSVLATLLFAMRAWWDVARNGVAERWRRRAAGRAVAARRRTGRSNWWREIGQDLRFALRMLRRKPAVAALSIVTLAVGIGATAIVYGVVDAALLRPLPLPSPDRLTVIGETLRGQVGQASFDNIRDWDRQSRAFDAIAAFRAQSVNLTGLDRPDRVRGGFVTSAFFDVAGVQVARGRPLQAADDEPNAAPVAVINDTFWQRRLGGEPDVLGRVVQLNNTGFEIVGVLPPGFVFPFDGAEVWLPARHVPGTLSRTARSFTAFGRLRPEVTIAQGQADLDGVAASLAAAWPAANTDRGVRVTNLHAWLISDVDDQLQLIFALVLILLLAAAANVASLQVGATAARRAEVSVRLALGAGRWRLLRQFLTEQLVIAAIAGALGVLAASWLLPVVAASLPFAIYGVDRVALDVRVVGFAAAITIAAGLVGGLLPALQWARRATVDDLRAAGRATGDRRGTRTRAVLVAAQVAMATVLVVASGLLVKSYWQLLAVDPGFRGDRVLTMEYRLPANKYASPAAQTAFHDAIVDHVGAVPGVVRAAVTRGLPLSGNGDTISYLTEFSPAGTQPTPAALNTVSGRYFQALGIPLLQGRTFDVRDTADAPLVAVVSARFAERAWPDRNPIGQTIVIDGSDRRPRVIGVVGDLRQYRVVDDPVQALYAHNAQIPGLFMTVVAEIGGDGDPMAPVDAVRRAVWSVDPDQPVWKERTLGSLVAASRQGSQFMYVALGVFAAAAVLLVVAGLYGVVSQSVAQQSREIGVKMMLGADRAGVLRQVLGRGLGMTMAGLAAGLAGAIAASNLIAGMLYRTSPLDAGPYVTATVALSGIALVACYLPARRAASIEPMAVLRDS